MSDMDPTPDTPDPQPETTPEDLMLREFCAEFAFGTPINEALRLAGYANTRISYGYTLLRRADAQAQITEHRRFIAEKLACDLNHVLQQLDRDREFAYQTDNPAAAVTATMNKARILGFMDPKQTEGGKFMLMWGGTS